MRFDLHIHSMYSSDGLSKPETIVKTALKVGLEGIAITDHNTTAAWNELEKFCKKSRLLFVKGEEIKVLENGKTVGELIGLFMNKEVKPASRGEVIDSLNSQGAISVIAHPFDIFRHNFKDKQGFAKKVNAVEAFNSRCVLSSFNKKAAEFAEKNNLAVTGGSDAHVPQEIGNAFTECTGATTDDLRKALLKKKTIASGKLSSPLIHRFSTIAKFKLMKPF